MSTAIGMSASAAVNVPYPSTSCRNCNDTKKKPNMAKNWRNSDADPVANPRWREQPRIEQRRLGPQLGEHESHEQRDPADEPDQRDRVGPAPRRALR